MGFDSRPGGSDPRCPRERVVQGVHQQRNAAFANAKITTAAILLRSHSLLKKPQKADLRSAIKQINRATAQILCVHTSAVGQSKPLGNNKPVPGSGELVPQLADQMLNSTGSLDLS